MYVEWKFYRSKVCLAMLEISTETEIRLFLENDDGKVEVTFNGDVIVSKRYLLAQQVMLEQ